MPRSSANLAAFAQIIAAVCIGPAPAFAQRFPVSVIDVHAHIFPDENRSFDGAVDAAIATMDRYGVETTIVMSPPRPKAGPHNFDIEDYRDALNRHPGRFISLGGGGTLNPMLHAHADPSQVTGAIRNEFVSRARRLLDDGAVGFGEISALHISLFETHGYSSAPADHPLLLSLADVAAERRAPIDLHMDAVLSDMATPAKFRKFPNNPDRFPASVQALERLLSQKPRTKIVWAHAGVDHLGDFSPEVIGGLLDRHANLYLSLKVAGPKAPTRNNMFARKSLIPEWRNLLVRHSDRFVIGTDAMYTDPNSAGSRNFKKLSALTTPRMKATILTLSQLPRDVVRKIGRGNAIRLYRLTGK